MNYSTIDEILPLVLKPGRYIGGEINSIKKDHLSCKLRFALAFPDTYEIGMSHLGLQILYSILNSNPDIAAERVYAPWPDMEKLMREGRIPLASLESDTPLSEFDIVGFSLQYELSYTNVLNMLDMGNVSIYASERGEKAPIIIAGGPCVFNPKPMSPFFDAFVIGEGEEVITDISNTLIAAKEGGERRPEILKLLSDIEGVWVPSLHGEAKRVKKRAVNDLNRWQVPSKPIVPIVETVHDRITIEVARGCTRGCRFCQAGMVWRPVRERSPIVLREMADKMLSSTGHNEISLLSLSSGDYSCIEQLLTSMMNRYCDKRVAIALPSLRVETLTDNLINQIKRVRKTSFTLAPEAGTQRLRDVINKGNTEEALLNTVRKVFKAGWRSIKLYFMIGLPTETQEDLEGIVDLAHKVLRAGENRRQVTVSISTFVPKPFTPFQWQRQITIEETRKKQDFFKQNLNHKNLQLKWHDPAMSFLEGILARGDEKTGDLVARVFHAGCRFDGWSDRFRFDLWQKAISELGIDAAGYMAQNSMGDRLPWDIIDCGVDKEFLAEEYRLSIETKLTADCRSAGCHSCGVCLEGLQMVRAANIPDEAAISAENKNQDATIRRLRIQFSKMGKAAMLSHLELSSAIVRAINISGYSFAFSEGFHPHPKISFPYAMPVALESTCEYVDIQLSRYHGSPQEFAIRVNAFLPRGIEILNAGVVLPDTKSLPNLIDGFEYKMRLPAGSALPSGNTINGKIKTFLDSDKFMVPLIRKGAPVEKDIRPLVSYIAFDEENNMIAASTVFDPTGGIKPIEILTHVLGYEERVAMGIRIIKTQVRCKGGALFQD